MCVGGIVYLLHDSELDGVEILYVVLNGLQFVQYGYLIYWKDSLVYIS